MTGIIRHFQFGSGYGEIETCRHKAIYTSIGALKGEFSIAVGFQDGRSVVIIRVKSHIDPLWPITQADLIKDDDDIGLGEDHGPENFKNVVILNPVRRRGIDRPPNRSAFILILHDICIG